MNIDVLEIQTVESNHADLVKLIEQLDRYLFELYPADEVFVLDLEAPIAHDVEFMIAYLNGVAVGCGAIKPLEKNVGELKRFFVEPSVRNRGIAAKMLQALEQRALQKGLHIVRLETGNQQLAAIGFYRKNGYVDIPCFGEYASCVSSICMEKTLTP